MVPGGDDKETFGRWLLAQLRSQGMDQAELAERIGVGRASVTAWVRDRDIPSPTNLSRIAEAFGIEVALAPTPARQSGGALTGPSEESERETSTPIPRQALATEAKGAFHKVGWYHRPAHRDGGREFGSAAAFAFDADLTALAREATQNSIDERLDPARPVFARYVLHELTGRHLDDFLDAVRWSDLVPHYEAAAGSEGKAGRILADALKELRDERRLLLLRVDDHGATGLVGGDYGDNSKFAAVVRDLLRSDKASPEAGGSYGLGKATLWAASRFGMVLINSTLSKPHEGRTEGRVVGRLELPWHQVGNEAFAGPAWFGVEDDHGDHRGVRRSWWAPRSIQERLRLVRRDSAPGTSFLVVGAHDASGDAEDLRQMYDRLSRALADNFWAAMLSGREQEPVLRASVVALRNDTVVIPEAEVRPQDFQPSRSRALQAYLDGTTVEELTADDQVAMARVTLKVPKLKGEPGGRHEHEAVVLVTGAEDADGDRDLVTTMRGPRMTVGSRRPRRLPPDARPFQAVLLAGRATGGTAEADLRAEAFLRAAEPPEHNDWRPTDEILTGYGRGGRTWLEDFRRDYEAAVRRLVTPPAAPSTEGAAARLRGLFPMGGAASGGHSSARPRVARAKGAVADNGSWVLTVHLEVPRRPDPWIVRPTAHFAVRSGQPAKVDWASLTGSENCTVDGDFLHIDQGAATAVFEAVTDPASHPVRAWRSRLIVDLHRGTEAAR